MSARPHRRVAGALASFLLVLSLLVLAVGTTPSTAAKTRTTGEVTWTVAPGVEYREWQFHSAAGPQRIHVLDIDPNAPGVSLDYLAHHRLRSNTTTRKLLSHDKRAVGGVNGSFFDIEDTGAPLGLGRSSTRGLLHAAVAGWNNAFYRSADGSYHIGPLTPLAQVTGHPELRVTGYNVPHARPNAVTVYTSAWGAAAGRRVVDDPNAEVREVHVRRGVVRQNSRRLMPERPFHGFLLLGVGAAAPLLKPLTVGSPVSAHWSLDQPTTMAITGSQILVQDGQVVASNDRLSAPRTAVGIDASTGHILLAALDGRQAGAAGLSTLAWADVLAGLGIGNALNLDGGGSTTMVARDALGLSNDVVNTPSLGYQRHLPDVLAVDYTPPAG
jgi:hypothetical protein